MYVHGWVYLEVLKLRARGETHLHVFVIGEGRPYGELSIFKSTIIACSNHRSSRWYIKY